jgi:alpha-1,3-mannosyltransferase
VLDPAPLYGLKPVKFRMADIAHGECSASECSLVANDYWAAGYGRIITVPRVKLAYDKVGFVLLCIILCTAMCTYIRLGPFPLPS